MSSHQKLPQAIFVAEVPLLLVIFAKKDAAITPIPTKGSIDFVNLPAVITFGLVDFHFLFF